MTEIVSDIGKLAKVTISSTWYPALTRTATLTSSPSEAATPAFFAFYSGNLIAVISPCFNITVVGFFEGVARLLQGFSLRLVLALQGHFAVA